MWCQTDSIKNKNYRKVISGVQNMIQQTVIVRIVYSWRDAGNVICHCV